MATFSHRGPWDARSRQSRALRFIEAYTSTVDSLELPTIPSSKFYAPLAIFHDTKGDVHISGPHIWDWLIRILSPFQSIRQEIVQMRVVPETDGKEIVYGEMLTHFRLKGDSEDIVVPRFFVWTLADRDGEGGTEGLQIHQLSLFWDTGIIGRYVTEKKRREERTRVREIDVMQS